MREISLPLWSYVLRFEQFCEAAATTRGYNGDMARGWESKAVESQIQEAESGPFNHQELSAADRETTQRKSDLLLSRARVLQQLEGSDNERYTALLRRTLDGLDAQIAQLS